MKRDFSLAPQKSLHLFYCSKKTKRKLIKILDNSDLVHYIKLKKIMSGMRFARRFPRSGFFSSGNRRNQ
jgi:hypothetical protein